MAIISQKWERIEAPDFSGLLELIQLKMITISDVLTYRKVLFGFALVYLAFYMLPWHLRLMSYPAGIYFLFSLLVIIPLRILHKDKHNPKWVDRVCDISGAAIGGRLLYNNFVNFAGVEFADAIVFTTKGIQGYEIGIFCVLLFVAWYHATPSK